MSKLKLGQAKPTVRLEGENVASYRVENDARGGEGRTQQVPIDRVDPSPFQVRRNFPESEIEALATSIRTHGLIHEPKGRPHPQKPGWVELMPGEMRLRAFRRLIERGEAEGVLQQDAEGRWLIPIKIDRLDDDRAEAIVFSENMDRSDLSPWEWALAFQQRRDSRQARGHSATVRDVAESLGKPFQTVSRYIQAADGITPEVLARAELVRDSQTDHHRMARLSLAALIRVALAAGQGSDAGAEALLLELKKAGDSTAAASLARLTRRKQQQRVRGTRTFQINIRQSLDELSPKQATHYLSKIAPVVEVLAERAVEDLDSAVAHDLAEALESALQHLRGRVETPRPRVPKKPAGWEIEPA